MSTTAQGIISAVAVGVEVVRGIRKRTRRPPVAGICALADGTTAIITEGRGVRRRGKVLFLAGMTPGFTRAIWTRDAEMAERFLSVESALNRLASLAENGAVRFS